MPEKLLRPADVAELLGVSYVCACMLMKSMRCINLTQKPGAVRPRLAVTMSEIDRWQKARTQNPDAYWAYPASPVKGKGGKAKNNVVEYDPNLFERDKDGNLRLKRKRA